MGERRSSLAASAAAGQTGPQEASAASRVETLLACQRSSRRSFPASPMALTPPLRAGAASAIRNRLYPRASPRPSVDSLTPPKEGAMTLSEGRSRSTPRTSDPRPAPRDHRSPSQPRWHHPADDAPAPPSWPWKIPPTGPSCRGTRRSPAAAGKPSQGPEGATTSSLRRPGGVGAPPARSREQASAMSRGAGRPVLFPSKRSGILPAAPAPPPSRPACRWRSGSDGPC